MATTVVETTYPITFREEDNRDLGEHLRLRHSVELIGMKRVGISNFLRFFLYHKDIVKTYINHDQKHLFIPVDLNDLVEREIYPFWALTLKRIVDAVSKSTLEDTVKEKVEALFLESIQSQELFLLMDSIRKAVVMIVEYGFMPTIFFLRFDRVKDTVSLSFFDNLQGLADATNAQLAYVFTSYRSLDMLAPAVFTRASLSVFSHTMYIKPAKEQDMQVIYETYKKRYNLTLSDAIERALFAMVNGNVQYLQLALIILNEKKQENIASEDDLFSVLVKDERIMLQSEELWESLTRDERDILGKVVKGEDISGEEKEKAMYLWETGLVTEYNGERALFSPLFGHYLRSRNDKEGNSQNVHFSKKEHLLFSLLQQNLGKICEREEIVEAVWPEYRELGVSDWAIDRLVARVRAKLKQQNSNLEIKTIRTRGYELVSSSE